MLVFFRLPALGGHTNHASLSHASPVPASQQQNPAQCFSSNCSFREDRQYWAAQPWMHAWQQTPQNFSEGLNNPTAHTLMRVHTDSDPSKKQTIPLPNSSSSCRSLNEMPTYVFPPRTLSLAKYSRLRSSPTIPHNTIRRRKRLAHHFPPSLPANPHAARALKLNTLAAGCIRSQGLLYSMHHKNDTLACFLPLPASNIPQAPAARVWSSPSSLYR